MEEGARYPFTNSKGRTYPDLWEVHTYCHPATTDDWEKDFAYPGYVLCLAKEFDHLLDIPNWNGTKQYWRPGNHTWSGLSFNTTSFKALIQSSDFVFVNEKERGNFLQEVKDCKYIWDDCIEWYCNKLQYC